MFEKLKKWLTTKPATKAAWIAASIGALTLIVITIQAYIYYRQTKVIERQLGVAEVQSNLLKNQTQLTTRPYVEAKLSTSGESKRRTLVIENRGAYSVRNIQVTFLYFAKVTDHGWWVAAPAGGIPRENLAPNESWQIVIEKIGEMLRGMPKSYAIQGGLEFVMILVSFEREFDGKPYLYLEPTYVEQGEIYPQRDLSGPVDNITGPLDRVCSPPTELTYEYFRRRPFPKNFEIYNYSYPLGYVPTGCLGSLKWIQ